jgi:DNA-binding helix-hairpin-helix protein with protein kinase domain
VAQPHCSWVLLSTNREHDHWFMPIYCTTTMQFEKSASCSVLQSCPWRLERLQDPVYSNGHAACTTRSFDWSCWQLVDIAYPLNSRRPVQILVEDDHMQLKCLQLGLGKNGFWKRQHNGLNFLDVSLSRHPTSFFRRLRDDFLVE